ncbi:Gfo/Idh/MocA family oxidoreductase [Pseudonocardia sp. C8]|uniref:Gfo/Idh/MocA family protein n=1 Tax=Pseudonocardia sp. C8 TaxID=2762759 RepID=UPI001642D7FD|nr:Gfo/Idh/MocA family oxidoreductase [Pseudonocardia sp. C8]
MSGRVGVGVVGAGVISEQYLSNLTGFPDLDVRYVASRDPARAKARAAQFGVPAFGDLDGLLADDGVDIVVNLTVPSAHVEVALAALRAGKHVWNEKPLATDRAGARLLLDTAATTGLRVAAAPDTVLGGGIQTARRLLDAGAIGTPLTALALMQQPGPDQWHPDPAFLFAEGAGPLLDLGPYYLTALVQLLGPITRVTARTARSREVRTAGSGPRAGQEFPVTVPTHVVALYDFAGGRSAQCTFSFDSPLRRTLLEITGTEAVLAVPDPNRFDGNPAVVAERIGMEATSRSRVEYEVPGRQAGRGTGVLELARAIAAGEPERASGAVALHVLDAMLATLEAGERGAAVDVTSTVTVPPALPADWNPFALTRS